MMDDYNREAEMICGALVREIARASTWQYIRECHSAMFHVRLKAKMLKREQDLMNPDMAEQSAQSRGQTIGPR